MISDMFNTSCIIQHITQSVNADGCPIETVVSTEVSPCFFNQLSGSKIYVNNVNSHIVSAQVWLDSPIPALAESFDVKFLTGCTSTGDIEITLGSETTVTISVTSTGDSTPQLVATAIAAGVYTNWVVTANDDTVNFTSSISGVQTSSVIDTNATGVTQQAAHFIEYGTDGVNVIKQTDKLVYNNVLYWIESVNTIIEQGLGQYLDLSVIS